MDLTLVGQGLLSGLLFGGVYSLMAVGLTLIFGVMRVVNFAHGDMMVWGMYLAWMLPPGWASIPYLGFGLCAAALFALGWAIQRGLVHRIVDAPHEMQILLMLGVALVLENAALVAFGPDPQRVRSPLTAATVWLGPFFVDVARLVTFGLALALTRSLWFFLARTDLGRRIRAAADNPYGALVIGTDVGPRLRGRLRRRRRLRGRGGRPRLAHPAVPARRRAVALGGLVQHRHHRRDGQPARRLRGRAPRLGRGVAGRGVPRARP